MLNAGDNERAEPKIKWDMAVSSGKCSIYQERISQAVTKVREASYRNVEEINDHIISISRLIREAALSTLPLHKPAKKQKKWYKDSTL